ncbi:cytidylate kinase [Ruminiclostridium papyrosolvens DSM 2782]|uniref:Cytidylate kinase n=1 Tax=Ruminiclostridium papyrosolvens DSM 2782 TaxID=588581 RepID=F1TA05_9FIRM|nr:(d)CMP kinase [Ruminiclostridium papyrosolvens]EGD48747.1 cytidylate kinase [Ruminiclostridium papyrosolvens DSM 2782]WES36620.1 (d)CMP kinase [Ruminiclostridium papyrosolvens DSM 2782]
MPKSIAIDGPAGAGKSTIAKKVSAELGFIYLDTGAMYRAVALKAIESGVDTKSREGIIRIIDNINIAITHDNNSQKIFLDGSDVSEDIRTGEVSAGAANVAAIKEVRLKMVELQRKIAGEKDVVMDGRDIGSYVLPNANLKIFLTADINERAKRRYEELALKGQQVNLDEVKEDMQNRDNSDMSRAFAPLKKVPDAVEIDSTSMTIEDVAEKILYFYKNYANI